MINPRDDSKAVAQAIKVLREPGFVFERVPNTVRQSYADLIESLSRQLGEARQQRDDYAEMWESNAFATAAAANRALTAEEKLTEAQGVIERMREALSPKGVSEERICSRSDRK